MKSGICGLLVWWLLTALLPAQDGVWEQMEMFSEVAPARQVGQPGNKALVEWWQQRFDNLVKLRNETSRQTAAQQHIQGRQELESTWISLLDNSQIANDYVIRHGVDSDEEAPVISSVLVQLTLEKPSLLVGILVVCTLMMGVTWLIQRRRDLLVGIGVTSGAAVLLLVLAAVVDTESERQVQSGEVRTQEGVLREQQAAAQRLVEWDGQGRGILKGLWQTGSLKQHTAAFVTGKASLKLEGNATVSVDIHPLAPNLVEPGNLDVDVLDAELIYVGEGKLELLESLDLKGKVILMDFLSHAQWLSVAQKQAKAIVFLEPLDGTRILNQQSVTKVTNSLLSVPRFYLQAKDYRNLLGGRDALRAGDSVKVRLQAAPSRWERQEVDTLWLYIPSRSEVEGNEDFSTDLVHLQAPLDVLSVVPSLSSGADGYANLVLIERLLQHYEKNLPEKPILISLVNDHANALQGEQTYGFFAFADASSLLPELQRISRQIAEFYFTEKVFAQPLSPALTEYLRSASESIGGFSYTVKQAAEDHLSSTRNQLRDRINLLEFALRNPDSLSAQKLNQTEEAIQQELVVLRREVQETIRMLGLFNRFGHKTYYEALTEQDLVALRGLFNLVSEKARAQRESLEEDRRQILSNLSMRLRLRHLHAEQSGSNYQFDHVFVSRYPTLRAALALTLDLYFGSDKLGYFHTGYLVSDKHYETYAYQRIQRAARFLLSAGRQEEAATGQATPLQDTVLMAKGLPWSAHLTGNFPIAAFGMQQYGVGALTLTSVQDFRGLSFGPHTTLQYLDRDLVERQLSFLDGYLLRVVESPDVGGLQIISARGNTPVSFEVTLRQLDRFSVEIPKTLLSNGLFLAMPKAVAPLLPGRQILGDVRAYPILKSNHFGVLRARGFMYSGASANAYGYTDDYRNLNAALDMGASERRFNSAMSAPRGVAFNQKNLVTFQARKVDIYGLTQPTTLSPVERISIQDARNNALATTYGIAGINSQSNGKLLPLAQNGTASVLFEPGIPFKLKMGENLAYGTTADNLDGVGFMPEDGNLYDLDFFSVQDLYRMAHYNLDLLGSKGVVNDNALRLNSTAAEEIARIEGAGDESTTDFSVQTQLEMARSHAYQAFSISMGTIADLVQAVVILLALIIPFCFFLMKLLCPYNDINRQLMFFMGTFVVTVVILYFIQPAFHVGERPEVVILAFLILGLAFFVGGTIFSRFNSLMNQAVEEINMSDSVDAPQGRLAGVAFGVGVNNMKRRRIRTSLTCATVVLVTFTALSVISVDQDAEPLRQRISPETPYTGIVFTGPGMAAIDVTRLSRVRDYFGDRATSIIRVWSSRKGELGEYLPYEVSLANTASQRNVQNLPVRVLLGLEVAENGFVADMTSAEAMLPGSRWFSDNHAKEIILSVAGVRLMGLVPQDAIGQDVVVGGMRLNLVGVIEDSFLESLKDLRGIPLVPLISSVSQDAGSSISESGDISSQPGITPARANTIALVPVGIAQSTGSAETRILSVKYATEQGIEQASNRVWQDANQLIGFQDIRLGVSFEGKIDRGLGRSPIDAGQYFLAPGSTSQIGGMAKVAIPMILAATIILNTMLGSVMERKKEVSIYNAIGLNPTHVMVFFLAESLVFGLVGAVAGYLIGQILSLGLAQVLDLNLNFSSLSVMVVIFLTIATVLLSTLYPAMMAARAAVPSGQRKWSLPKPEGDEIHLQFPFSYDRHRVLGVCAYLHEFMNQNSEASTGKFLATFLQLGRVPSVVETDEESMVMLYRVSPPPFDLGVNQLMEVYAHYNPRVKAYMLSVHLTRQSGDATSWITVNQPFLEALRKKLLGWRSQKASLQQEFYEKGRILFEGARTLPTKAD